MFAPFRRAKRDANLQASRQQAFGVDNDGEDCFTADRIELLVVVAGLVGTAGTAIFRRVHVEEALDHFAAIESGKQKSRGFPRANSELSRPVRHGGFLAVLEMDEARNRKYSLSLKMERPGRWLPGLRSSCLHRSSGRRGLA